MRDRILINKELIPYKFNIAIYNQVFGMLVKYNSTSGLFTIGLYKDDVLIATEPVIYGVPLFKDIYRAGEFPAVDIIPCDESGNEKEITFENLGKTVYLTIDDGG